MQKYFKNIYFASPYLIQNIIVSLKGFFLSKKRFNKKFKSYLSFYQEFNKKSLEEQKELELNRLKLFLVNAEKSEYWKKIFKQYKIDVFSNNIEDQISKLPIMNKDDVKKNIDSIVIDKRKMNLVNTSGTTGTGLHFYESKSAECERWAVWWNYRINNGIKFNQWHGWFGGTKIISSNTKNKPFWRVNIGDKRIMFSLYHLNDKTIDSYLEEISLRKLEWLHGYPSQIALLASLGQSKNTDLSFVKNITFGSENTLANQLNIIKAVFKNAKLSQHYGLAESVVNISETNVNGLKLDRYFSYSEFVPTKEKNKYWIIGTNLSNPNFPLIRYNTGDIIEIIDNKIISIDGRKEDYITLPDGTKLGRLDHIFKNLIYINEAQIYQPTINLIIFKIVKGELFDIKNEEVNLINEIKDRFNNKINWEIQYLNSLKKTKSGKLRFVISDLK